MLDRVFLKLLCANPFHRDFVMTLGVRESACMNTVAGCAGKQTMRSKDKRASVCYGMLGRVAVCESVAAGEMWTLDKRRNSRQLLLVDKAGV